jgi:hypothetical protein
MPPAALLAQNGCCSTARSLPWARRGIVVRSAFTRSNSNPTLLFWYHSVYLCLVLTPACIRYKLVTLQFESVMKLFSLLLCIFYQVSLRPSAKGVYIFEYIYIYIYIYLNLNLYLYLKHVNITHKGERMIKVRWILFGI